MVNELCSVTLVGSKQTDDNGVPKYTNFGSIGVIPEDTLEDIKDMPKYAALANPVGFLKEDELTEEALSYLHPVREFAGILMQTEEFKAGTHPCQALIQGMYDKDPSRYSYKKDEEDAAAPANQAANGPAAEPATPSEALNPEQEY